MGYVRSRQEDVIQVAYNNDLVTSFEHLTKLELKVRNRMEVESWLQNPLLFFNPKYLNPSLEIAEQHDKFFEQAESASDAVVRARLDLWFPIIQQFVSASADLEMFRNKTNQLLSWLNTWVLLRSEMEAFLTTPQIDALFENLPDMIPVACRNSNQF